jgi:hypothetical protein
MGDLEARIVNLVRQHTESTVFHRGTKVLPVSHERYRSGNYEQRYESEETPNEVIDDSRRKAAYEELLKIGKNAVPTLVKILSSESGEYPHRFSGINDGVLPALNALADERASRCLIKPFEDKVLKIIRLNAEKYDNAAPYFDQIWSIALLWARHPVPEAIPALDMIIGERVSYCKPPLNYLGSEFIRPSFFDALSSIATEEAILSELNFAKEDAGWHQFSCSNNGMALRSLERNIKKVGPVLYDIYRSTGDADIKGMASDILGRRKAFYWAKSKLGM